MMLLSDYTFSDTLRYEGHRIYYRPAGEADERIFGGIYAAAIMSALLVDTDEGDKRGIALETPQDREAFYIRYERETRREDGGLFANEIQWLHEAAIELDFNLLTCLPDICGSMRIADLAFGLAMDYMSRIAVEEVGEHIYDKLPFYEPFAQWLYDAAFVEARRQRILQTDWYDAPKVFYLSTLYSGREDEELKPLFEFEGEDAKDLMQRYLDAIMADISAQAAMKPNRRGALYRAKVLFFKRQTDPAVIEANMPSLSHNDQTAYREWYRVWENFITVHLKDHEPIRFWANDVDDDVQEHILYHMQNLERKKNRYLCITALIYAMRRSGYIRQGCDESQIREWLSVNLSIDYTERTATSQFQRAMKKHFPTAPAVVDEMNYLETLSPLHPDAPKIITDPFDEV